MKIASISFAALTLTAVGQRAWPFYPGHEKEVRLGPFEKRKASMPTGWETPAWKAFTYVSENARPSVVYDHIFTPQADQHRRDLFRELDKKLAAGREEELTNKTQKWASTFQKLRQPLHAALKENNLHVDPAKQVIVSKFSMAVPAIPSKLYKTIMLFEGVRCLTHLPKDIAMAITAPSNFEDYVALRGFLSLIPDFAATLPEEYPLKIVVHHDERYRQWGNRWMAANYTSILSEWITFWDNDDFPEPKRYYWYDQIFTAHPEQDVFLAGKWYVSPKDWKEAISVVLQYLHITDDNVYEDFRKTNKSLSDEEVEDLMLKKAIDYDIEEGYNEPLRTMDAKWLEKWRVGSIIGAPLYVGREHFIGSLYDACYEALNHTELYTQKQIDLIKSELAFLDLVPQKGGLAWGDRLVQDGWSTIRREILNLIHPPTRAQWGEDSLYNWMIGASGFNYFHMVSPFFNFRSGIYFRWPKKEDVWDTLYNDNDTKSTS